MKPCYTKGVALSLLVVLIAPHVLLARDWVPAPVTPYGTQVVTIEPDIKALEDSLTQRPTHFEYTKYKMLKNRRAFERGVLLDEDVYSSYRYRPRGASPLSREYSGVPLVPSGLGYASAGGAGIDLITGGRAITESLQLGSIGETGAETMSVVQQTQYNSLQSALSQYRQTHQTFPETLMELDLQYAGLTTSSLSNFTYKRTGRGYSLVPILLPQAPIPISAVEGLTIKHHPWVEMIGDAKPTVPAIYSVIPADYFFVHFNNMARYMELEATVSRLQGPLSQVYGMGGMLATKERVLKRLGVNPTIDIEAYITEAVFVAHDFDGYPATDYALVLDLDDAKADTFVASQVIAGAPAHGPVGDYYVLASGQQMFDHIRAVQEGRVPAMATSLDLKYSLTVLEKDRDGFAFISDAFVERLTSPAYRINAARRNAVLTALESLQYASFAFRDLTGRWPTSIEDMVNNHYLVADAVYQVAKYRIDANGVVMHEDWGSIYNVTPIARVSIDTVTPSEKARYDRFREGYQEFWREFIDPVAVSVLVGDQIQLHTIILPLIDETQYNWIKNIVGSENSPLDFVRNPDRVPAVQLTSQFDIESILYGIYQTSPSSFDPGYKECVRMYHRNRDRTKSLRETCQSEELSQAEATLAMKKSIADAIDWKGDSATIFDFMGNEAVVAASENATFMIDDLSAFDVYAGIEFSNPVKGQAFIDHLTTWIREELFGGRSSSYGMFGITAGKPIKNTYNNVEYYMIPTGFINIFYIYINDRMYVAISQMAINALIDGKSADWSKDMLRLQDYLPESQHVSLLVDGKKINTWLESFATEQVLSYAAKSNFEAMRTYLKEVGLFDKLATGQTIDTYYSHVPTEWFGIPLERGEYATFLITDTGKIDITEVSAQSYYSSYWDEEDKGTIKFNDLIEKVNLRTMLEGWADLRTFGANLNFTEHGLDIRVAFNNHARSAYDSRVPTKSYGTGFDGYSEKMLTYVGIGFVAVLMGALLVWSRRRHGVTMSSTPATNSSTEPTAPTSVPAPTPFDSQESNVER